MVPTFRLTFGWAALLRYWGLIASAVEHAHCNTTLGSALISPEGKAMTSHVKIVDPWETGKPTQIPSRVKVTALQKEGPNEPFFTSVYVGEFIMASVQVDSFDQTALVVSASHAPYHVRLFGSGEKYEELIFAIKKSNDRNSIVDALGFASSTPTIGISITKESVHTIPETSEQDWPRSKKYVRAQDVLSMAGKLWNLNTGGKSR